MKIGLFEASALRRAVEAYDTYLSAQLALPADRRDSLDAAATRFRHIVSAERDAFGGSPDEF